MRIPAYAKTIVALVVALAGVLTPLLSDDLFGAEDIVQIALFLISAVGVYVVPNAPVPGQWRQDPETGTEYKV